MMGAAAPEATFQMLDRNRDGEISQSEFQAGFEGNERRYLMVAVFRACDADKDDFLDSKEMRLFAEATGFKGDDTEWAEEFNLLCSEHGADSRRGVHLEAFRCLVDDRGESGCYCSDSELKDMLQRLQQDVQGPRTGELQSTGNGQLEAKSRKQLIQAVFTACDTDGDMRLNQKEMADFARHTGFEGTDQEWDEEFALLCQEHQGDWSRGVDLGLFTRLVDDESDNGIYCTDEDLKELLTKLDSKAAGRWA
jgi:Ca2+-binding EF-hand superfamily protein